MSLAVNAAAVFSAGTLLSGLYVLREEGRLRRAGAVVDAALSSLQSLVVERPERAGIRRRRNAGGRWRLAALFGYDAEAPQLWSPKLTAAASVLGGSIAFLLVHKLFPGLLPFIAGVLAAIGVSRFLFGWQLERYSQRLIAQMPDAVQLVVGAVRSGLPLNEALRTLAQDMPDPTGAEFRRVMEGVALGRPLDEALLGVYQRTRVREYAIFSVTLSVQSRAGGRLAETLQILSDTIRERIALAGRARALSAEAKFSARVLTALPFLSAGMMSIERPDYLAPLLYTHRGNLIMAAGLTSLMLGVLTMRQMIKAGTRV